MDGPLAMPRPSAQPFSPLLEREAASRKAPRPASTNISVLESDGRPDSSDPQLMALEDGMMFLSYAAQALSRDEFSRCFEPRPSRTPRNIILYWFYWAGIIIRYGILFPIRLSVILAASFIFVSALPALFVLRHPHLTRTVFWAYCHAWLFSFSAIIRHHGRKPTPREPHLFVANHTSFIDYFLMSSYQLPHATVAQVHGGLFGWFQRNVLTLNGSLFFNRSEHRDRLGVSRKMQAHIDKQPQLAPLIIFPEGTCVNNESTVLFHKGAFELDALICPVAIKYNKRLLDPYWNTREQTFTQHALYLMTRWLMVADVWWLPPQRRRPGESAILFANRVKAMISDTSGLKNLSWDGYMKNCMQRKDQEKMRKNTQEQYVSSLKRRLTPAPPSTKTGEISSEELGGEEVYRGEQPNDSLLVSDASTNSLRSLLPGGLRRRSSSFTVDSSSMERRLGHSLPIPGIEGIDIPIPGQPYLPPWLSEKAIVDIKNELLISSEKPAEPSRVLLDHISNLKDGVVQTWRYFNKAARMSPSAVEGPAQLTERRIENSSWRLWFKQRQQSGTTSTESLATRSTPILRDSSEIFVMDDEAHVEGDGHNNDNNNNNSNQDDIS